MGDSECETPKGHTWSIYWTDLRFPAAYYMVIYGNSGFRVQWINSDLTAKGTHFVQLHL